MAIRPVRGAVPPPGTPQHDTALVIGRFQPVHNGHLHLLREAARVAGRTVVVVGSADKSHTAHDPFTAGERIVMLEAAAREAGLALAHVIPVDDLGKYHLWVSHVAAHVPPFDVVVTGSALTERLFTEARYNVHRVEKMERGRYRATTVRERMARGEDVSDAVPAAVHPILGAAWVRERLDAIEG